MLDSRTLRAISHPTRVAILRHLSNHDLASPSELAKALGVRPSSASYHVRSLASLGFLELVKEVPRRNAVEHFYRLGGQLPAPLVHPELSKAQALLLGEAPFQVAFHAKLDKEGVDGLRISMHQLYIRIQMLEAETVARVGAGSAATFAANVRFVVEPAVGQSQARARC